MKIYVHVDTTALCMLYTECKSINKDVTISIVHSEMFGDYAIISTYRTDIEVLRLVDKVGLKERLKENRKETK